MVRKDILVNGIFVGSHESSGDLAVDAKAVNEFLKEKGLWKEVSHNDSMYRQANSFAEVSKNLYKNGLRKSPFKGENLAPFIVNSTFAIELYLKTIHNACGNNIRGHHLYNIYKGIPKIGKVIFDQASVDVRPHYKLEKGEDIYSCLKALSKSFEDWRYIYEKNEIAIEFQSIRYVIHVSHEACCRVRENEI